MPFYIYVIEAGTHAQVHTSRVFKSQATEPFINVVTWVINIGVYIKSKGKMVTLIRFPQVRDDSIFFFYLIKVFYCIRNKTLFAFSVIIEDDSALLALLCVCACALCVCV